MKAAIVGIAGPTLSPAEAALFRAHPPAGVILFARNIHDPDGLAALTRDLRRVLPPEAELMVDQEGGRVARLRPPHWQAHPSAGAIGALFARNPRAGLRAAWLTGVLIGQDCIGAGFNLVAAPVLDLSVPGAHDVIGDRAYASHPAIVARLARAVAEGLMAGGVIPIGKHVPGHGRARVDSHLALPRVDANDLDADLLPFALNANLPWFMTAHIVYAAFDPISPATLSGPVIERVIRGRLGFRGVLVTDDLAMKALSGAPADLATRALAAGCDVALYCPGDADGNAALLAAVPEMTPATQARMATAHAMVRQRCLTPGTCAPGLGAPARVTSDRGALAAERDRLLA